MTFCKARVHFIYRSHIEGANQAWVVIHLNYYFITRAFAFAARLDFALKILEYLLLFSGLNTSVPCRSDSYLKIASLWENTRLPDQALHFLLRLFFILLLHPILRVISQLIANYVYTRAHRRSQVPHFWMQSDLKN